MTCLPDDLAIALMSAENRRYKSTLKSMSEVDFNLITEFSVEISVRQDRQLQNQSVYFIASPYFEDRNVQTEIEAKFLKYNY